MFDFVVPAVGHLSVKFDTNEIKSINGLRLEQ